MLLVSNSALQYRVTVVAIRAGFFTLTCASLPRLTALGTVLAQSSHVLPVSHRTEPPFTPLSTRRFALLSSPHRPFVSLQSDTEPIRSH